MKMKSVTTLSVSPGKTWFVIAALCLLLPRTVAAETEPGVKVSYEGSLFKMSENNLFCVEIKFIKSESGGGEHKAEPVVYDGAGNDVENAEITVSLKDRETEGDVPAEVPVITEKGAGFYTVDHILPAEAHSRAVRITVSKEGAEDSVIFDFPQQPVIADDIAAFLLSLTGEMPRDFMSVPVLPEGKTGSTR